MVVLLLEMKVLVLKPLVKLPSKWLLYLCFSMSLLCFHMIEHVVAVANDEQNQTMTILDSEW
jgi:hypothetical protein